MPITVNLIGAPLDLYQCCRLPFGMSSILEVFQTRNYDFSDTNGVAFSFDYLILQVRLKKSMIAI